MCKSENCYYNFLERIKKGLVLERTIVWQDLGVIFAQNKSFICDKRKISFFSITMGSKSLWSYISTLTILWNILWKSQVFFKSQSCWEVEVQLQKNTIVSLFLLSLTFVLPFLYSLLCLENNKMSTATSLNLQSPRWNLGPQ